MTNANDNTVLDLDTMMDETLDATVEAPDFLSAEEIPAGSYMVQVTGLEMKAPFKAGGAPRVNVTYTIKETVELVGDESPVPNESMFSDGFQWTEQGKPYFKKWAMNVLDTEDMAGVSMKEIFDEIKGTEPFNVRISTKKSIGKGENAGKEFININVRVVR